MEHSGDSQKNATPSKTRSNPASPFSMEEVDTHIRAGWVLHRAQETATKRKRQLKQSWIMDQHLTTLRESPSQQMSQVQQAHQQLDLKLQPKHQQLQHNYKTISNRRSTGPNKPIALTVAGTQLNRSRLLHRNWLNLHSWNSNRA